MIIKNADVYTEEGTFVKKDIYITGGLFANQNDESIIESEIDATDCYAIPALTDIHFHGCAGYDFCDRSREAIAAMAEYEASVGVANIVPATMTLSEEELTNICATAKAYKHEGRHEKRARLCGINMEGPFISFSKKGAQNKDFIKAPDILMFDRLNGASGYMIRLVSIAPELDGAMEFIEKKHGEVIVSLAHTDADYDTSICAFEKGANHVTHLYNAMNPYTHRAPGPIGAAADTDGVDVELICDGVHIHPAAVRTTFKMFGDERIIFVSDSMRATGLEDGSYTLGGQEVEVVGNLATLKDGTIAGSVTNLMDCLRTAVLKMGIPLEKAVKCAAVNPAKCIGIYDKCGSITAGKYADLVLLKKNSLETVNVIMEGKIL
ncbi:MAG: N-acetylglucosamine-6-phosphate deacetylase [Lachnospiraceae bacterium]|nr:N-acetylglucosamine-6-phosphate deacetylase [Lachnospiraceae bacterium]